MARKPHPLDLNASHVHRFLKDARFWAAAAQDGGYDSRVRNSQGRVTWGRCWSPAECKANVRTCLEHARWARLNPHVGG